MNRHGKDHVELKLLEWLLLPPYTLTQTAKCFSSNLDSTCSELGFQRRPLPLSKALPQHLPISPPSTSRPDPGLYTFEVPAPTPGQAPHCDACNASEWMREETGTLKGSRNKWHSAPRAGHAVGVGAKVRRARARAPSSPASRSVALPTSRDEGSPQVHVSRLPGSSGPQL